jgi:hypothetical protein
MTVDAFFDFCNYLVINIYKEKIVIGTVQIQVKPEEIIEAIKGMEKRKREAFLEDLIAATSPEYLSVMSTKKCHFDRREKSKISQS